ncbi:LysR family transcriptional regulator [Rhodovarius crocodyli]|uniref:LysR family transcriptional regulator n=1 Tax=Rhodovarius crocodyli TaxID=1979269 RepID=A0A437MES3_9PROT|nr:LysR substrate-binding domain-containing protein [Rhodovarius crocodyli]RVT96170.1 LysR family transcriptional regulator [Rhodovarius crocodyli]
MNSAHVKRGALPLIALRAFEAAARRGSFQDGAQEVGLTPSAVSHHVRQLEATIGAALFERHHRRVSLTPPGEALAGSLAEGFEIIGRAYARAAGRPERLVVSASPGFAARWLLPAAQIMREEGIELQVDATPYVVDVENGACDVAIRLSETAPPRLAANRLATSPIVLLTSAKRMAGRSSLDIEEIAAGPLLGQSIAPHFWPEVLKVLGVRNGTAAEAYFDSFDSALQAVEGGYGFTFAPEILVAQRVADGTLALALPRRFGRRRAWSYWFVSRPEVARRAAVRRLFDVLVGVLGVEGSQALKPPGLASTPDISGD